VWKSEIRKHIENQLGWLIISAKKVTVNDDPANCETTEALLKEQIKNQHNLYR
jgi:hypothetical protein